MPLDPRDYDVELSPAARAASSNSAADSGSTPAPNASADTSPTRPYLSVLFDCCGVYLRIYRSATGDRYDGRCPRCAKSVRFTVGPGGTSARVFRVT